MSKSSAKHSYHKYVASTIGFGIFVVLGFIGIIYFLTIGRWGMSIISFLIMLVGLDNFFCGTHLKMTGTCSVNSHYVIPPFLRRKKR